MYGCTGLYGGVRARRGGGVVARGGYAARVAGKGRGVVAHRHVHECRRPGHELFVIRPMMRRTEKLNTDEHVYVGSPDALIAPNRKVQRRSEHLAQGL